MLTAGPDRALEPVADAFAERNEAVLSDDVLAPRAQRLVRRVRSLPEPSFPEIYYLSSPQSLRWLGARPA